MIGPALLTYLIGKTASFAVWRPHAVGLVNAAGWLPGLAAAVVPLLGALLVIYLAVRFGA